MKNDIVKLGLILAIISCIASGILAVVNGITEPIIMKQEQDAADLARKELLPDAKEFEKQEKDFGEGVVEVYKAVDGSNTVGFIITTETKGYGGKFNVITGINSEGVVSGVKLGTMNETPGLGAKATEPKFIDQYSNLSVDTSAVVSKSSTGADGEIVAISGATITSNAVTNAVNAATELYKQNLK